MGRLSYRRGIFLVVGSIALAAVASTAIVSLASSRSSAPAAENLGEGYRLGDFDLIERSDRKVDAGEMADRVWVTSFIFTRCPSSCPRISALMKGLQEKLRPSAVRLVSISVDPDHDTPTVLGEYARKFDADPDRWWFLTGKKPDVYRLILERFHISVSESSSDDQKAGAEAVAHSDRLALVDVGNRVDGIYDSTDPKALQRLIERASRLDRLRKPWVKALPAVNATLNGTCAILLVIGWLMIRSGRTNAHVACMISGVLVSAVFLTCYLVYHYFAGSKAFEGPAGPRFVYYTILISHTLLATFVVVPFVSLTLYRAIRRQFDRHSQVASVTLPVWIYVSITGVVIYWMLYQMSFPTDLTIGPMFNH